MQKFQDEVTRKNGDGLPGASVLVTTLAGSTATIYSDNGFTPAANPLTTDELGEFFFYAPDGRYSLTISGPGIVTRTRSDILLEDPVDDIVGVNFANRVNFSGTGAQTTFNMGASPDLLNNVDVYINGIYQNKDTFSLAGTNIVFSEAPPAGTNNIEILVIARTPSSLDASAIASAASATAAAGSATSAADSAAAAALSERQAAAIVLGNFQQDGTGSVARTFTSKARESVSLKDFGGVVDGIADDTAALQAAVNYCKQAGNPAALLVQGTLAFNPAGITWTGGTQRFALLVDGALKPSTTLVVGDAFDIQGIGGGTSARFVQFTQGVTCDIIPPAGAIPTVKIVGAGSHRLSNVSIYGCHDGIVLDGATGLGALARLDNVNVTATQAGGRALVIDAFFWAYFNQCRFLIAEAAANPIVMTNTSTSFSETGLIYFTDCITAGTGIRVDPAVGNCGNIYFTRHHHESLPAGADFFYAKPGTYNVTFDQLGLSDPLPGAGLTFDIAGLKAFKLTNSYPQTFRSLPASMGNETDLPFDYINATREIGTRSPGAIAQSRGALSARLMSRGHMTMAAPGIGASLTINVPSGVVGDLTFTGGQCAPDGSNTATKVEPTGAGSATAQFAHTLYQSGRAVVPGDVILLYAMVKILDTTSGGNSDTGVLTVGMILGGSNTGTSLTGVGRSSNEAPPAGLDHALADDGWMPVVCAFRSTVTGTPDVLATLVLRKACAGMLLWKPSMRVIPASYGFGDADINRLVQSFGGMHNAQSGVMSVMEHQPFRTGLNTTANRPTAAAAGQGAQFFDTTLNKPIWSDGANWRDAAGTVV